MTSTDLEDNGKQIADPEPDVGAAAWAERRLQNSAYGALKRVRCECRAKVLSLRGQVPSYYLKQMAQSLVATAPGAVQIDNQLEVMALAALGEGDS